LQSLLPPVVHPKSLLCSYAVRPMVSSDSPDSASFAKTSSISILAATSNLYQNQIKIPNFNQSPTSLTSIKIAFATRTWRSHNSCLNSNYKGSSYTTKYHGRGLLNIPFINCRIQSKRCRIQLSSYTKKNQIHLSNFTSGLQQNYCSGMYPISDPLPVYAQELY
jgi:hypothetical protein